MLSTVLILANPFSGHRSNRPIVAALESALRERGLGSRCLWSPAELAAELDIPGVDQRYTAVVVAGGDGTVSSVLNTGAELRALPLAHMPLGTENLFARQFGHPRDPQEMAELVATGKPAAIDLGSINGRIFSIVASAGYDGQVIHHLHAWRCAQRETRGRLRRVRRWTYTVPMCRSAATYRFPTIEIDADGQRVRGALAMVFNLPQYGMGLPIAPDAQPDDGMLDWFVLEKPGVLRLAWYAGLLMSGRLEGRPDMHRGRARRIALRCDAPVPMQIDGEGAGFAPAVITTLPAALQVLKRD